MQESPTPKARRAGHEDVAELVRLRRALLDEEAAAADAADRLPGDATDEGFVIWELNKPAYAAFVVDAPDGNGLAACAAAEVLDLDEYGPYAEIQSVITDRPWRRRGYGQATVGVAMDWLTNRGHARIHVETFLPNGTRLYQRLGFSPVVGDEWVWAAR